MAYIGNPPADRYSKLAKQDLTGDGTIGPYTLDYAVGSVAEIEIFVNNIRQEPTTAYTVAGDQLTMTGTVASTDDFYVVFQGKAIASGQVPEKQSDGSYVYLGDVDINGNELILDADGDSKIESSTDDTVKIISGGNTGLTIDSSGQVSMPNTVEIDHWRLTTSFTTDDATITGWERNDDATSSYAGTGMTESSGVFTFPKTGLYKVTVDLDFNLSSTDSNTEVDLFVSSDSGSNYDQRGHLRVTGTAADVDGEAGASRSMLVNVTDASTFRFKLVTDSLGSGSFIAGNTNFDRSSILFERITDSQ